MNELFLDAIEKGDLVVIRELLAKFSTMKDKGNSIILAKRKELSVLALAAENGHLEVLRELIPHFISAIESNDIFQPACIEALRKAAAAGHTAIIRFFIEETGTLPLKSIIAVTLPLKSIIERSKTKPFYTAVTLALKNARHETLRYLLSIARTLEVEGGRYGLGEGDSTPADMAILSGDVDTLKLLYRNGCDVSCYTDPKKWETSKIAAEMQVRMQAAFDVHLAAAELLKLAKLKKSNRDPVEELAHQKHIDRLIDTLGDSLCAREDAGNTALHFAILQEHSYLIQKIISLALHAEIPNVYNVTPMANAAMKGDLALVKKLSNRMSLSYPCRERIYEKAMDFAIIEGRNDVLTRDSSVVVKEGHLAVINFLASKLFLFGDITRDKFEFFCFCFVSYAAERNKTEILNFLLTKTFLRKDAVIKIRKFLLHETLEKMFYNGQEEALRFLYSQGMGYIQPRHISKRHAFYKANKKLYELRDKPTESLKDCTQILGDAINACDTTTGDTILHIAFRNGNRRHILELIETFPNINVANTVGETSYTLGLNYLKANRDSLISTFLHGSRAISLIEELITGFEILNRLKENRVDAEAERTIRMGGVISELTGPLVFGVAREMALRKQYDEKETIAALEALDSFEKKLSKEEEGTKADIAVLNQGLKVALKEFLVSLGSLNDKIAKLEIEANAGLTASARSVPSVSDKVSDAESAADKPFVLAAEELEYCKRIRSGICFQLGSLLATPEESPLHPLLAYELFHYVEKKDRENFKLTNRLMYHIVLQHPDYVIQVKDEFFDREKQIFCITNHFDLKPSHLLCHDKTESECIRDSVETIRESDDASRESPAIVKIQSLKKDKVEKGKVGKDKVHSLDTAEEETQEETQENSHDKTLEDKILKKTIEHLIYGEFEDQITKDPMSHYIIGYTQCLESEQRGNILGIDQFKDYKDPDSFLALLQRIRDENLQMKANLAKKDTEIEKLKAALVEVNPHHPLLQEMLNAAEKRIKKDGQKDIEKFVLKAKHVEKDITMDFGKELMKDSVIEKISQKMEPDELPEKAPVQALILSTAPRQYLPAAALQKKKHFIRKFE